MSSPANLRVLRVFAVTLPSCAFASRVRIHRQGAKVAKKNDSLPLRVFAVTSILAGVAPEPAVLRNSKNVPLYLLCFAVGNARGKDIALRIANHLLKEVR